MTPLKFVACGVRFYWRNHLSVGLGAALATAIFVGALLVGDSVRFSLERLALLRLGQTESTVASPTRFFRSELADDLGHGLQTTVAPVLSLRGMVSTGDSKARVNRVQIVGVDERFWTLGNAPVQMPADGALINEQLARRLNVQRGQPIVIRVEKPSWRPLAQHPLSSDKDLAVAVRVAVSGIVADEQMGRFSLLANQVSPASVVAGWTGCRRRWNNQAARTCCWRAGLPWEPTR